MAPYQYASRQAELPAARVAADHIAHARDRFAALADRRRLRLMRVLVQAESALCVAELVDILMEPQYAVSRAVGVLRRAGLVQETRDGRIVSVAVTPLAGTSGLAAVVRGVPEDAQLRLDADRLRWRLELRIDGECRITYPRGYNPPEYGRSGGASAMGRPRAAAAAASPARAGRSRSRGGAPERVLFVCVHNSARSQLAEEYLRRAAGARYEVESAGLEPGELNPCVVEILAAEGIAIADKATRSVFDVYRSGRTFDLVITVCDPAAGELCPSFPGPMRRLSWPFPDPAGFSGSHDEVLAQTRHLAHAVRSRIEQFVEQERMER